MGNPVSKAGDQSLHVSIGSVENFTPLENPAVSEDPAISSEAYSSYTTEPTPAGELDYTIAGECVIEDAANQVSRPGTVGKCLNVEPPPSDSKLEWSQALNQYLTHVNNPEGLDVVDAFEGLVSAATNRSKLKCYQKELAEAQQTLTKASSALANAKLGSPEVNSTLTCHTQPRYVDPKQIAVAQSVVEVHRQEVARLGGLHDEALNEIERLIHEALVNSVAGEIDKEEVVFSPMVLAMLAETMAALGEFDRAIEYYDTASLESTTIGRATWYRLQALQLDVARITPEEAPRLITEIEEVRDGLPNLMALAKFSEVEQGVPYSEVPSSAITVPATEDEIHTLDAFSWVVQFDAVQLATSIKDEGEAVKYQKQLKELLKVRRQTVQARIGEATPLEVHLHLSNAQRVITAATMRHGIIERTLHEFNLRVAKEEHQQLVYDIDDIHQLVRGHFERQAGDPIYERLATLNWQLWFDGYRRMDLPHDGLKKLADVVLPQYADSFSIRDHMESLREEARQLGIEPHIFNPDGSINVNIDVSKLPAGILAGDRTRSAYTVSSNGWRESGLPLGAMLACGGVGLFFSETIVIPTGAALLCGGGAIGGNYSYNTRVAAAEQYRQSLMTGLTQVSKKEARRNWRTFYLGSSLNLAFGAMFAAPGGCLTNGLLRGVGGLISGGKTALKELAARKLFVDGGRYGWDLALKGVRAYRGMSLGGKVRLPLGLLYPADYLFLDKDYNIVLGDGKVDTALGYLGAAAFWSRAAYKGFSWTWKTSPKDRPGFLGFVERLEKEPWRGWLIHAGSDAIMADEFLFDKDFKHINFSAPQETESDKHSFNEQFALDNNWLSLGGLVLMGADWAQFEARALNTYIESYIESLLRVRLAQARMALGAVGVAADLVEDAGEDSDTGKWRMGDLDKWYLGGLGGALLMNEIGSVALQVDAWGSMVATGFRVGTEWLMQWQQDMPIRADAKRLMWASGESAFMRFPAMTFVKGGRYLSGFPLGRRALQFHQYLHEKVPLVANLIRPVQRLGGPPKIKGWRVQKIKPHTAIKLMYDMDGNKLDKPVNLFVLKPAKGSNDVRVRIGERIVDYRGMTAMDIRLLKMNRIFGKSVDSKGLLWRVEPEYRGEVNIGLSRRKVTSKDLAAMDETDRGPILRRLEDQGIFWQPPSDGNPGGLFKRWYKDPKTPQILSSHGKYVGGKTSDSSKKIMSVNHPEVGEVWIQLDREMVPIKEPVKIGGWNLTTFTGALDKPRLWWGIPVNAALTGSTVYLANKYIFRPAMDGDPVYQLWERTFNYGFSEAFTHPFVQWPLGYQTWQAQLAGRFVGIAVHLAGNELFPVYLDSFPGAQLFYEKLDGKSHPVQDWAEQKLAHLLGRERPRTGAMDVFTNNMSSTQVAPVGLWGESDDTIAMFEPRAFSAFQGAEGCWRSLARAEQFDSSTACKNLHGKTKKAFKDMINDIEEEEINLQQRQLKYLQLLRDRAKALAKEFEEWIDLDTSRKLSTMQQRALVIMAAHIKMALLGIQDGSDSYIKEQLEPWRRLEAKYPQLFKELPSVVMDQRLWNDFIRDVNRGNADALKAFYHLHQHSE